MTRRKFVGANWKMNGVRADLPEIEGIAAAAAAHDGVDVAVCVPFTLIEAAARVAPGVPIGAQDCHDADWGAHTGCVAAPMLVEAVARTVIVGHSERRGEIGRESCRERVGPTWWITVVDGTFKNKN